MYLKTIGEGGLVMSDKISVIIRSKNEARWIGHTIQSVLDFLNKPEIIIVDNYSFDNSSKMVTKEFPEIKLIQNSKNRGYVAAKNRVVPNAPPVEWPCVYLGRFLFFLPDGTLAESTS